MAASRRRPPRGCRVLGTRPESSAWVTRVRLTAHYDLIQTLLRCKDLPKEMHVLIATARDHVVRFASRKEIVQAFVRHFTDALKGDV